MTDRQFGPYEIKKKLGAGGMATVYQGYDPRFQRDVAIKVMRPEALADPTFRARFEREAQTLARLEHPAIVQVYDFGEVSGTPYLVMRMMSGGSLAARMIGGRLPPDDVIRIISRIAPALDLAHSQGIIHRDLKPDNILFDQFDEPYISDFGLVKLSQSTGTTLTSAGIAMGTPAYMSPEQVTETREVDWRSDIYSLAVIVYEMLAGKRPFQADTPMALALKHVTEPVPKIHDHGPDLPAGLEPVLDRALAKNPEERFSSAREFAAALDAAMAPGGAQTPAKKDGSRRVAAAAGAAAAKPVARAKPAKAAVAKPAARAKTGRPAPVLIILLIAAAVICLGGSVAVLAGGGDFIQGLLGNQPTATATATVTVAPTRTPAPAATPIGATPLPASTREGAPIASPTRTPTTRPDTEVPQTPTLRPTLTHTATPATVFPTWTSTPVNTPTSQAVATSPPQPTSPQQPTSTPEPTIPPPPTPTIPPAPGG
jgi:tRNA A-37 threonylcarbamoyl transferase component Bud32